MTFDFNRSTDSNEGSYIDETLYEMYSYNNKINIKVL